MSNKTVVEKVFLAAAVIILSGLVQCDLNTSTECPNVKTSLGLIRKRRHLIFPDGTNVALQVSTVKSFMTHAPSGWFFVMEVELVYHLPNHNVTLAHMRKKLHHRQKREFWDKLKTGIDYHNLNGRACVLRSICEAEHQLAPPGQSLVHDLLRAVFTAPLHEEDFVEEVKSSYGELLDPGYCDQQMECPFSPLHFILSLNEQKY